jgi:predicted glutamine amidotransferase
MCGIAYIKLKNKTTNWPIRSLLFVLSQRGSDTWGFLGINRRDNSFLHEKLIGNICKFTNLLKIRKLLKSGFCEIILHSRYATNGYTGLFQNIQPISLNEDFFLAHNGLVLDLNNFKSFKNGSGASDSYEIATKLVNMSNKRYEKYLNERKGEITMVFTNVHEKEVNAYTNVGGLYLVEARGYKIVLNELPRQTKIHKILYGANKVTKIPNKRVVKIN